MGRRVIAIVAALVVALVGAGAVVAYASSADERAVAGQQVQKVYIAQAPVPAGTTLRQAVGKKLIAPKDVVAKGVPAGALGGVSEEQATEVALSTITPGSIVLEAAFGTPSKQAVRASAVPKGKVAITVSLADPERIAPLLEPGSHIVVYDTYTKSSGDGTSETSSDSEAAADQETHVLLPDAEVVAVGKDVVSTGAEPEKADSDQPDASAEQESAPSALVTVAVTPEDGITLVHGVRTGTLYAGLLGESVKIDRGQSVSAETLFEK